MSWIQALILGLIQGITEFFPVSSSAHLYLARILLHVDVQQSFLFFDLICHTATLFALLYYLKKDIFLFFEWNYFWRFFLSLIPLIPAYFFLKPFRIWATHHSHLGFFLIITSLFLFIASKNKEKGQDFRGSKWTDVLCIGCMQTLALIPGISRSGSTIATARWLGWNWIAAARFSFLLSIPTILGGQLLEWIKMDHSEIFSLDWKLYLVAFISAFFSGLVSVHFIFSIYKKGKVKAFAWYCLSLGLFAIWFFHG